MENKLQQPFSKSQKFKVALASGWYPLLHYYNGNFDISDSWVQLGFMLAVFILLPILSIFIAPILIKFIKVPILQERYPAIVNFLYFFGLLAFFILLFKKKATALVVVLAFVLGFWLYNYLKKIVLLQFLLAFMSLVLLVPKLYFMFNYDSDWTHVETSLLETKFVKTPNIYLIQPDGYANREALGAPPYSFDNSDFERWLSQKGFVSYDGFRSNYYSTLTSNASMFAMKHHYYQNTYPGNLKTYGSQAVIVGQNNVLSILKGNGYSSHLITDNSFFLTNRKLEAFDDCNIPQERVLLYDTGGIYGIDIVTDFQKIIEKQTGNNFYFIEKTLPSHIMYTNAASEGIELEREHYLERLQEANVWISELVKIIEAHDENPLIILAADHGGFVGLKSVKEVETKKLNTAEAKSVFESMLSIKWPYGDVPNNLDLKSTVNLFRNVFSYLSEEPELLKKQEINTSYLPLYEGLSAKYYQVLDNGFNFGYKPLKDPNP